MERSEHFREGVVTVRQVRQCFTCTIFLAILCKPAHIIVKTSACLLIAMSAKLVNQPLHMTRFPSHSVRPSARVGAGGLFSTLLRRNKPKQREELKSEVLAGYWFIMLIQKRVVTLNTMTTTHAKGAALLAVAGQAHWTAAGTNCVP